MRITSRRQIVGECESMKVHLIQPQVLLLQGIRDSRKFIGKQGAQVAFLAADQNSNVIGVDHCVDFDVAESRRAHANPHFRLLRFTYHLGHLHRTHLCRTGARRGRQVRGCREIRGPIGRACRAVPFRFQRRSGTGSLASDSRHRRIDESSDGRRRRSWRGIDHLRSGGDRRTLMRRIRRRVASRGGDLRVLAVQPALS